MTYHSKQEHKRGPKLICTHIHDDCEPVLRVEINEIENKDTTFYTVKQKNKAIVANKLKYVITTIRIKPAATRTQTTTIITVKFLTVSMITLNRASSKA